MGAGLLLLLNLHLNLHALGRRNGTGANGLLQFRHLRIQISGMTKEPISVVCREAISHLSSAPSKIAHTPKLLP